VNIGRVLTAVFTGGASEVVNQVDEQIATQDAKAEQEAEKRMKVEQMATALMNEAAAAKERQQTPVAATPAGEPAAPAVQINACCAYQIVGDYLLETTQGTVWRFDSARSEFLYVPREKPPFERAMTAILISLTKDKILGALNALYWKAPEAQKPDLRKAIDAHAQAIAAEMKKLMNS
jgi:hypothetical protein